MLSIIDTKRDLISGYYSRLYMNVQKHVDGKKEISTLFQEIPVGLTTLEFYGEKKGLKSIQHDPSIFELAQEIDIFLSKIPSSMHELEKRRCQNSCDEFRLKLIKLFD